MIMVNLDNLIEPDSVIQKNIIYFKVKSKIKNQKGLEHNTNSGKVVAANNFLQTNRMPLQEALW